MRLGLVLLDCSWSFGRLLHQREFGWNCFGLCFEMSCYCCWYHQQHPLLTRSSLLAKASVIFSTAISWIRRTFRKFSFEGKDFKLSCAICRKLSEIYRKSTSLALGLGQDKPAYPSYDPLLPVVVLHPRIHNSFLMHGQKKHSKNWKFLSELRVTEAVNLEIECTARKSAPVGGLSLH